MNENRSQLRLWTMSAAVVLLLHGVVVIAVLKWHKAAPREPLLIDLAPSPAAPNLEPSLQPSLEPNRQQSNAAPIGEPSALPAPPEPIHANFGAQEPIAPAGPAIEPKIATSGGRSAEPTAAPQGLLAPQAPPPSEDAKPESGAPANTASGGGVASRAVSSIGHGGSPTVSAPVVTDPVANSPAASSAVINNRAASNPAANSPVVGSPVANAPVLNDPFANSPIDTSIAVQPSPNGKRGLAAIEPKTTLGPVDQKGGVLFRPAGIGQPEHLPGVVLPGVTATRAAGAHVQDRVRAAAVARQISAIGTAESGVAGKGGASAGAITTNALGTAETGVAGNGVGTVATNSIGIAVRPPERLPVAPAGERSANSVTAGASFPAASVINGRSMVRPGSGIAVLGGPPARAATGALSGTNFHVKVP